MHGVEARADRRELVGDGEQRVPVAARERVGVGGVGVDEPRLAARRGRGQQRARSGRRRAGEQGVVGQQRGEARHVGDEGLGGGQQLGGALLRVARARRPALAAGEVGLARERPRAAVAVDQAQPFERARDACRCRRCARRSRSAAGARRRRGRRRPHARSAARPPTASAPRRGSARRGTRGRRGPTAACAAASWSWQRTASARIRARSAASPGQSAPDSTAANR